MSRIFWDSNLFIYFFEQYQPYSATVKALAAKMLARGDELFTSTLSIGEILAKPYQLGDMDRCDRYERAIREAAVILPFDLQAARQFAKLRAQNISGIRPPDAIQLACAATAGIDLFLTNDTKLHSARVEGIHFITSAERAPL